MEWFYRSGVWVTVATLRVLARWEVTGRENVPAQGSLIVAANHASYIDPPLLVASVSRRVRFLAHEGLFQHPLVGLVVRGADALRVERESRVSSGARRAIRELRKGSAIGLFPEGHRNLDGVLGQGKPGIAYVALKTGASVLPVGIAGSHRVQKLTDALKRPHLVVKIGTPLALHIGARRPEREQLDAFTEQVMREIAGLLPTAQRGIYQGVPGESIVIGHGSR